MNSIFKLYSKTFLLTKSHELKSSCIRIHRTNSKPVKRALHIVFDILENDINVITTKVVTCVFVWRQVSKLSFFKY